MRIFILDSTLHDGTRSGEVYFSLADRLLLARKLDEFGIDYIDGGNPAANPHDREFFARAHDLQFKHARLAASGCVRAARNSVDNDPNVKALFEARTPVVCLSGESWDLHVYKSLHSTGIEHKEAISDSIRFFKQSGREVIYNAEHFFDAYEANPDFAMETLQVAHTAGADSICLCDTNGGTLTSRLAEICHHVRRHFAGTLGIHAHNDSDLAVANTLAAVEQGFDHVQGCLNGYGERSGCANLCSILPNLELKAGHMTVGREPLERLDWLARFVAELANLPLRHDQPFVGAHHKAVHVQSMLAHSPLAVNLSSDARRELLDLFQQKERAGYDLAGADGTFELLLRETLSPNARFFNVLSYEVTTRMTAAHDTHTAASVTVEVDEAVQSAGATGTGPVCALDSALRQCLAASYPAVVEVRLTDYKVRVLEPGKGTAAKVRVLVEWTDGHSSWTTAGVSANVIEASWLALTDSLRLELLRLVGAGQAPVHIEDYSWAV